MLPLRPLLPDFEACYTFAQEDRHNSLNPHTTYHQEINLGAIALSIHVLAMFLFRHPVMRVLCSLGITVSCSYLAKNSFQSYNMADKIETWEAQLPRFIPRIHVIILLAACILSLYSISLAISCAIVAGILAGLSIKQFQLSQLVPEVRRAACI